MSISISRSPRLEGNPRRLPAVPASPKPERPESTHSTLRRLPRPMSRPVPAIPRPLWCKQCGLSITSINALLPSEKVSTPPYRPPFSLPSDACELARIQRFRRKGDVIHRSVGLLWSILLITDIGQFQCQSCTPARPTDGDRGTYHVRNDMF
jgi:hypothetical protein